LSHILKIVFLSTVIKPEKVEFVTLKDMKTYGEWRHGSSHSHTRH